MQVYGLGGLVLGLPAQPALSQNYLHDFHNRNAEMKAVQPSWMAPLVMTTPLLGQFVREEFVRQRVAGGKTEWNVGNGKGLSLLVSKRLETDLAVPNYVVHGSVAGTDGVGDFGVTTKYRLFSGNQKHGNYVLTAIGNQTWTTGQANNGAVASTRALTLAGGQGDGAIRGAVDAGGDFSGVAGAGVDRASDCVELGAGDACDAEAVGSVRAGLDVL